MFVVADVEPRNSHIANEYWIHVQNCALCIDSVVRSIFHALLELDFIDRKSNF